MRVLFCTALVAAVLLGGAPTLAPPAAAAPMDRYVDPVNGWSISYPAGWRIDGSDPAVTQIRDPENQALVGIRVASTNLPLNAIADQILDSQAQYLQEKGQTWALSSRQLISFPNGTPAVDVRGDLVPGGRSHQLFLLKGGRAFAVNAETSTALWGKFNADFDGILLSFTLPA